MIEERTAIIEAPISEVWGVLPEVVRHYSLSFHGLSLLTEGVYKVLHLLRTKKPREPLAIDSLLGGWKVRELHIPTHLVLESRGTTMHILLQEREANQTELTMRVTGRATFLRKLRFQAVVNTAKRCTRMKHRHPCNEAVLIETEGRRFPACVIDISQRGCRVKSEMRLFQQAQPVTLQFGGQAVQGKLCNKEEKRDVFYYGVQFDNSQDDLAKRLK